jgi:DNA mismatch endonuclease (patch repair protein)
MPRRRIAIFVDGDFWHSCPVHGRTKPFTGPNAIQWTAKLRRNRIRDLESTAIAESMDWTVIRVWECSIVADVESAARSVLLGVAPQPAPSRPATAKQLPIDGQTRQPAIEPPH